MCTGGQGDVSVMGNLLFMSVEETRGRVDCGGSGVEAPSSPERFRGVRIFDISDIDAPRPVGAVQTCRGSHTHTLVPGDAENVYVYVSGTAGVRPATELAGCSADAADAEGSSYFRIEVIKVPLAHPDQAAIVNSARFLLGLPVPPAHAADLAEVAAVRARGGFTVMMQGREIAVPDNAVAQLLGQMMAQRGATGTPTAADSAALRAALPGIVARMGGGAAPTGPTACHDITVYPQIGLAGGACDGYGLLLDIRDPANPQRIEQVGDANFAYWHSATFNNDGTKVIFTDEWGGGTAPRCRATDRSEWGANAIFTLGADRKLTQRSYYKLPAAQTSEENCVAHNGSLVPVPGRDVMAQAWYQGGLSVFDFTDAANPREIAYFDRGPMNADEMQMAGYWSVYWHNGYLYGSEIGRGIDIFRLTASDQLTTNELAAASSVMETQANPQLQTRIAWTPSVSLARAYLDQVTRASALSADTRARVARDLTAADAARGAARRTSARTLAATAAAVTAGASGDASALRLATALTDLGASMMR